jgi:hypothetical protein
LTSGLRLSTAKRKLSRFVFNLILAIMLLLFVILRVLLWPLKMLNKGLGMSAQWMVREWRA